MYSKEDSRRIKKEFWTKFGRFSQRKRIALGYDKRWLTHNTGIISFNLKFDFEKKEALVGIEISSRNKMEEENIYSKLLALKTLLNDMFDEAPIWNPEFELTTGKKVIKVYHILENVNIHNKECWPTVFNFFFDYMIQYETFYKEYKDFIRDDE